MSNPNFPQPGERCRWERNRLIPCIRLHADAVLAADEAEAAYHRANPVVAPNRTAQTADRQYATGTRTYAYQRAIERCPYCLWKALGEKESAAYRRVLALDSSLRAAVQRGEKVPDGLAEDLAAARKDLIAIQSDMDCFGSGFSRGVK